MRSLKQEPPSQCSDVAALDPRVPGVGALARVSWGIPAVPAAPVSFALHFLSVCQDGGRALAASSLTCTAAFAMGVVPFITR